MCLLLIIMCVLNKWKKEILEEWAKSGMNIIVCMYY
jgi:hypothetical protein